MFIEIEALLNLDARRRATAPRRLNRGGVHGQLLLQLLVRIHTHHQLPQRRVLLCPVAEGGQC
jgi:hypothetical protein